MSDADGGAGSFQVIEAVYPFESFVALHVRWPGNRLDSRFPLNLLLEVEEHHLTIRLRPNFLKRIGQNLIGQAGPVERAIRLRVRLSHCYIRHRSKTIDVIASSKYESTIVEGKFSTRASEKARTLKGSKLAAGVGSEAVLSLSKITASLDIRGNAKLASEKNISFEAATMATPEILEVRAVPNGWRTGHPDYGDPTKPSRCLEGRYFDRIVPEFPYSCEAEFLKGENRGELVFSVMVRDGIRVERADGNDAGTNERVTAVAAMRDRIAAIRLERHLATHDSNLPRADDEVPLAVVTCEAVRATDDNDSASNSSPSDSAVLPSAIITPPFRRTRKRP